MTAIAQEAITHWGHVAPALAIPNTEAEYEQLVIALDEVLNAGGADENNPLAELASHMGDAVEAYEAVHYSPPDGSAIDVLRFLMDQHELTQSELPEIGAQSVVSAILSGKRELNVRQVSRLSRRFGVSADVFLAD